MTSPKAAARPPRALSLVFLVGLALRVGFGQRLSPTTYQPDEGVYVSLARNIRAWGTLGAGSTPTADKPPVTPALIAAALAASGERLRAARLLWALLSFALAWLLWLYATRLFGRRAGLLAGGAAALYPFFVYWSGIVMSETPSALLCVAALLWTQALLEGDQSGLTAALAGLAWGLAILTRAQYLYCWLLSAAWLAWASRERLARVPWAAFLLPALLLAGGWAARNRRAFGTWAMDNHAGYTLVIRTMFYDQDNVDTRVADDALRHEPFYLEAERLPPAEADKLFLRKALEWIGAHPALYLRHCAGNFVQLWRFYPRLDKSVGVVGTSFLSLGRGWFALVSLLTEPWLILLGLAGAALALRERRPVALPLLFVAANTAIHTLVISQMRYRLPMMPLVIVFAAFAAGRLLPRARRG